MSLTAYILRAVTALIIMSSCAFFIVRYSRKKGINIKSTRDAEILTSLRLTGRDIFYVIKCGPDVIAFTISQNGACFMGRWSYEEWQKNKHEE